MNEIVTSLTLWEQRWGRLTGGFWACRAGWKGAIWRGDPHPKAILKAPRAASGSDRIVVYRGGSGGLLDGIRAVVLDLLLGIHRLGYLAAWSVGRGGGGCGECGVLVGGRFGQWSALWQRVGAMVERVDLAEFLFSDGVGIAAVTGHATRIGTAGGGADCGVAAGDGGTDEVGAGLAGGE